jgi:1,4-dihydroxy-2-naphthoyl-CoA hydrolase
MRQFTTKLSPRFHQTDSAGLLFFNEAFTLFHDAYEEWVEQIYGSKKNWFQNEAWAVPIKKVSGDFRRPLLAFDSCEARVSVKSVGETSFQLETELLQNGSVCCTIESVHVFLDKEKRIAQGIPDPIREKLKLLA